MNLDQQIKEHILFDLHLRNYIRDCINAKLTDKQILKSFEIYIFEVRKE